MYMEPRDAFVPPRNPQTGRRPTVSQMSEDGTDNWAVVFGFNLPLWFEKNEAGIREARRRLSASIYQHNSTRNMIEFRIEDALARVCAQQELAELFDGAIIPQARQAYEIARAGYKTGKTDFQYVIDNWQKWLMFEIQYHRALGELEVSIAGLEQAVGSAMNEHHEDSATGGQPAP
jgi:outer membrane protein TolC